MRSKFRHIAARRRSIKIETCGDCNGYLKICYPEHDNGTEIVADDLAMHLDFEAEKIGVLAHRYFAVCVTESSAVVIGGGLEA